MIQNKKSDIKSSTFDDVRTLNIFVIKKSKYFLSFSTNIFFLLCKLVPNLKHCHCA